MRRSLLTLLLVLLATGVPARDPEHPPRLNVGDLPTPPSSALAPTDTFEVLGGVGTLSGKFETAAGEPDLQGWFGVDLTQPENSRWAVGSGQAANLDPDNSGNLAWTCQELFEPCTPDDPPEGYADDWSEILFWTGAVADPGQAVTVRVRAVMNHDVEPPEDFLFLEHRGESYWFNDIMWTGEQLGRRFDETLVIPVEDFQGHDHDQVHLRWRFSSDGAWDDSDCLWPTRGAAQIDSIVVTFDQGAGEQIVGWVETCEPGVPTQWQPIPEQGVGDYAQIWPQLDDLDETTANSTPRLAFIDDGVVEPGTGGTPCITWCYGPGGWIVPNDSGLAAFGLLENQLWSPPFPVPDSGLDGALLACDLYLHSGDAASAPYIYPIWGLRSTADPSGETGWGPWTSTPMWLWGGPETVRLTENVSHGLVPDAALVQVALGLRDAWGWGGLDGTPAPYFDNVSLKLFARHGGASLTVRPDGLGDVATIQDAVMIAASGDTIVLADGVYGGPGNRDVDLQGKSLVLRSAGDDPSACVIDCLLDAVGDHRAFRCGSGTTLNTVIRGVTVRGGRQDSGAGAVYVRYGGVTLENCVFIDNRVLNSYRYGGAVTLIEAQAEIRNCVFRENVADHGAALSVEDGSQVMLEGCLLVDNHASREGSGLVARGAGTEVIVSGCTLVSNREQLNHGVLMSSTGAHMVIDHTIVADTELGTPVWCVSGGSVSITCSDFFNNHAGDWENCATVFDGQDGNISADPLFCGDAALDQPYGLDAASPCAPEQSGCGLMGAYGVTCEVISGVDDAEVPASLSLAAGIPNPANPATTVRFAVPTAGMVRLQIHDLRGRLVRRLVQSDLPAGNHSVLWTGRDDAGRAAASGVYIVRLEAAGRVRTGRLTLVR